jgi:hypothetical protein
LTIAAVTDTKTYDGNTNSGAAPTHSALISGDSISTLTQTFDSKNASSTNGRTLTVGSYTISDGNNGGNYDVTVNTATGTINKAPLGVELTGIYNGTTSYINGTSGTATFTGLVNGETLNNATLVLYAKDVISNSTNYVTGVTPGSSDTASMSNYQLSSGPVGTFGTTQNSVTITPATVSLSNVTKTYDGGTGKGNTTMVINGVNGETLSVSDATYQYKDVNDNNRNFLTNLTLANNGTYLASNYKIPTLTLASAQATISKAVLTVTPKGATTTYDGSTLPNTTYSQALGNYTISGFEGSDTASSTSFALTGSMAFNGATDKVVKNADTYALTQGTLAGTETSGNYAIAYSFTGSPSYLINRKSLTLAGTRVYDGTYLFAASVFGSSGTISTGINSETLILTGSGSVASAHVNAGSQSLTLGALTLTDGSGSAANYQIAASGNTGTITAKTLTVTAPTITAKSKTYDASAAATDSTLSAGNVTGFAGGDSGSLNTGNITLAFDNQHVAGSHNVVASGSVGLNFTGASRGSGNGSSAGNEVQGLESDYSFSAPSISSVSSNITAATATLVANKVYDGAANFTTSKITVTGVNGETLSLSGNGPAEAHSSQVAANATNYLKNLNGLTLANGTSGIIGLASDYILPALDARSANNTVNISSMGVVLNTSGSRAYDSTRAFNANVLTLSNLVPGDEGKVVLEGSATVASKDVGTYTSWVSSTLALSGDAAPNYTLEGGNVSVAINKANLTISGLTANNKTYDATTTAFLSGTASLSGVITGETVILGGSTGATFADKNVGAAKAVTVTGYALSGADSGNYSLIQPSGLSADITAKSLNVTGLTADNKVYDATTVATLSGTATIAKLGGDVVNLDGTSRRAIFADKNVGAAKAVTVTGYVLNGADSGNYTLVQPSGLIADITAKSLNVTGLTADNKIYDATTAATLSGTATIAKLGGDVVSLDGTSRRAIFADKNVGAAKAVMVSGYALNGADSSNYTLIQPSGLIADITAKSLNVTGLTADSKVYDATTAALLSGTASLNGVISGETVTLAGTGSATFADKNVGSGKAVTVTGYTIGGTDSGNYSLAQPSGLTAAITPAPLTITALSNTKTYDGATKAAAIPTVSGLKGNDTVTGLSEVYQDPNPGIGKNLTVQNYIINDGNEGRNYIPSLIADSTGVIKELVPEKATETVPVIVYRAQAKIAGDADRVIAQEQLNDRHLLGLINTSIFDEEEIADLFSK